MNRFLDEVRVFDKTVSLREFKNRQIALENARNLLTSLSEKGYIVEEGFVEVLPVEKE